MENIQESDTCQHSGCACPRPTVGDYCSDYCKDAWESGTDGECQCGHSDCE